MAEVVNTMIGVGAIVYAATVIIACLAVVTIIIKGTIGFLTESSDDCHSDAG